MKSISLLQAGALSALVALACLPTPAALAQTPGAASRTLSGGSGGGPLLTREELRVCMKEQEAVRVNVAEVEGRRAPLDAEMEQVKADQVKLEAERGAIEELRVRSEAFTARSQAYADKIEEWNKRAKDLNDGKMGSGRMVERHRNTLNKDRADLEKERVALEAERQELTTGSEEIVRSYNAKADALTARVDDWNDRNQKWTTDAAAAELRREEWLVNCGDRRYREDDEIAIRRGQ